MATGLCALEMVRSTPANHVELNVEFEVPACTIYSEESALKAFADLVPNSHLLLVHANVRDLRVTDRLPNLSLLFCNGKRWGDIIVVSETWFKDDVEAKCYQLPNFEHVAVTRKTRSGGGVSIFVHRKFRLEEYIARSSNRDEVQILKTVVSRGGYYFTIIAFYSRAFQSSDILLQMLEAELAVPLRGAVILTGDANINVLEEISAAPYLCFLASKGFIQCIQGITRFASKTCLDHIWVGRYHSSTILKSGIIQTNVLADHYPVFLSIGDSCPNTPNSQEVVVTSRKPRRIFSTRNFLTFTQKLHQLDWASVLAEPDPEIALQLFFTALFPVYESAFPLITFNYGSSRGASNWFNNSLRIARRELDKAGRRLRFSNDPLLRWKFKLQRSAYKKAVRIQYNRRIIGEKINVKPKQASQAINGCVGRKAKNIPSLMPRCKRCPC